MMEFVSWDDDIPNIWKTQSHVPNHQPARISTITLSIATSGHAGTTVEALRVWVRLKTDCSPKKSTGYHHVPSSIGHKLMVKSIKIHYFQRKSSYIKQQCHARGTKYCLKGGSA